MPARGPRQLSEPTGTINTRPIVTTPAFVYATDSHNQ